MSKVLFVTHHYLNGNGGGVFASRAYINAFAELFDDLTLLYPIKEGHEIEGIISKVKAIAIVDNRNKIKKILDFVCGNVHRYKNVFRQELLKCKPDIVVFDNSRVSFGLIDIAHDFGCKVITIHHNYEYEYNRDNTPIYLKKIMLFWTKRYEQQALNKSDISLALTSQDIDLLCHNYKLQSRDKIQLIGCFESQIKAPILNIKTKNSYTKFIITGNLSDRQSENSILPWIKKYYPLLKRNIPNSTLIVAGKSPSSKIKEACKANGIQLEDSPIEMQPILRECDVYICPVDLGGGLKLRVMDGLKNGMPVIAHIVSSRGYDYFIQKGYLYSYSDEKSFVETLNKLQSLQPDPINIIKAYDKIFDFREGVIRLRKILEYANIL